MFVVGLLSWWYGAGWKQRIIDVRERLLIIFDYFSIDLLVRTLFSPFRQISAGQVRGPLGVQVRAFFDQLISRSIGAVVRSMMVTVGVVCILVTAIVGAVLVVTWAIVPLLPVVGVVLAMMGWIPWTV